MMFGWFFLGIFFKSLKSKRPLMHALGLSAALLGYSLIWQGWVFLFLMAFICAGAAGVCALVLQKDAATFRAQMLLAAVCCGATVVAGSLIYGLGDFLSFFTEGAGELGKFTIKGMSLWPNLFIEVGELKKSSLPELMSDTGGMLFIAGAIAGLAAALRKISLKTILVMAFCAVTVVLTLKAERFAIFTLAPLSLFFGLGTAWGLAALGRMKHGNIYAGAALCVLLASSWINAQQSIRTVLTPIYNSVWDEAMRTIKNQTPSDSIVNTWWPPGHFIKAMAHRRVPFDGASISAGAVGYWMANALLSTDENEARGIIRMLNLSRNQAVEFLTEHGIKTSQAVALVRQMAALPKPQAKAMLKQMPNPEAETLLTLTHGSNPHSYVLVYNEIVDENLGLAFVGRRDFQKIEELNTDPSFLSRLPPPDSKEFIDFLWSVSGGTAPKYSEALSLVGQNADGLMFGENLKIRADMGMAAIDSEHYGRGVPKSLVFKQGGRVVEREIPHATLNYTVVLYEQDGLPTCRLMDRDLADSMLMRMFFFDGAGLKNFKLLKSSSDLTGRTRIKTFQVLWD